MFNAWTSLVFVEHAPYPKPKTFFSKEHTLHLLKPCFVIRINNNIYISLITF